MKSVYSFCIFTLFIFHISYSQTGTIKIAKPKPAPVKKDSVARKRGGIYFYPEGGFNFSFKQNKRLGYFGGVDIQPSNKHGIATGLFYSREYQYYELSPYNKATMLADTAIKKSQTVSDYIQLPLFFNYGVNYGGRGNALVSLGLRGEYLLKTKDEQNRLGYSDYNHYNAAAFICIGAVLFRRVDIVVGYSKDLFSNLRDKRIYNSSGEAIGKQKSRTNLVTFTLRYGLHKRIRK